MINELGYKTFKNNLRIGLNKQKIINKPCLPIDFEQRLKELKLLSQQAQKHKTSEWSKKFKHIKDWRERKKVRERARWHEKNKAEQQKWKEKLIRETLSKFDLI